MDFRYTEDEQALIDAAKSVLTSEVTSQYLRARASEASDQSLQGMLWQQFVELGFMGMMAPETMGGLGQSLAVMAGIAEAAGYVALPEPLVEMAGIAVPILAFAGECAVVEAVLRGTARVGVVSPLKPYLTDAENCTYFWITADAGGRLLDKAGVGLTPVKSIDPLRRLCKADIEAVDDYRVNAYGAVLGSAQLVGLAQRLLDLTVSYTQDRQQFGQPIAVFQAVKHQAANVYTQIEFTRPLVQLAAVQLEVGQGAAALAGPPQEGHRGAVEGTVEGMRQGAAEGERLVHAARIAAIDTAMLAAETAIQLHGAMGYTHEADIHFFMKRVWALCGEWGDRSYHMRRLEETVFSSDAALGPGTGFLNQETGHG